MIRRYAILVILAASAFVTGYHITRKDVQPIARVLSHDFLDRNLPHVELHQNTVGGTIQAVHEMTGLDVVMMWPGDQKTLTHFDAPFDPDLSLHDIPVGQLLHRLSISTDPESPGVHYRVENGLLLIEPPGGDPRQFGPDIDATGEMIDTCIYHLEPLVLNDGLWEKLIVTSDDEPVKTPLNLIQREEYLEHTIRNLIAPDSWKDAGGTYGAMRFVSGQLVVTQTLANQRAIYEVIKTLRAAK